MYTVIIAIFNENFKNKIDKKYFIIRNWLFIIFPQWIKSKSKNGIFEFSFTWEKNPFHIRFWRT